VTAVGPFNGNGSGWPLMSSGSATPARDNTVGKMSSCAVGSARTFPEGRPGPLRAWSIQMAGGRAQRNIMEGGGDKLLGWLERAQIMDQGQSNGSAEGLRRFSSVVLQLPLVTELLTRSGTELADQSGRLHRRATGKGQERVTFRRGVDSNKCIRIFL
jgi:hypothetical protein